MNKKFEICIKMMRQLVSDIQGAPYPSDNFEPELYKKREDFDKTLKKMFK